ncbi:MAG TPA: hypothetical protein VMB85_17035 [Bryobacteraceae bacterium]|nr:hypothetical protein [Bryobacteraceae bacterium]
MAQHHQAGVAVRGALVAVHPSANHKTGFANQFQSFCVGAGERSAPDRVRQGNGVLNRPGVTAVAGSEQDSRAFRHGEEGLHAGHIVPKRKNSRTGPFFFQIKKTEMALEIFDKHIAAEKKVGFRRSGETP